MMKKIKQKVIHQNAPKMEKNVYVYISRGNQMK